MLRSPLASAKKTYGQNAEQLYVYARKLLKGGNFEDAQKAFQRIKTKYPFSSFSTLAELGLADCLFQAGKFLRAIDIYKLFVKLHPTHTESGYASYQVGECYDKLRPWDWFLVPPSYEKDATHIRQAIQAYREFLQQFPKHKLVDAAKKKISLAVQLMAKHELYVASFYEGKGLHRAVVWRMEYMLKKYPGVGFDAEARFRRAGAFAKLKEYDDAVTAYEEVVKLHPKSRYAQQAKTKAVEMKKLAEKAKKEASKKTAAKKPAPAKPAPRATTPAVQIAAPAAAPTSRPAVTNPTPSIQKP